MLTRMQAPRKHPKNRDAETTATSYPFRGRLCDCASLNNKSMIALQIRVWSVKTRQIGRATRIGERTQRRVEPLWKRVKFGLWDTGHVLGHVAST